MNIITIKEEDFEVHDNINPSIPYRLYQKDRKKNFYAYDIEVANYVICDYYGTLFTRIDKKQLDDLGKSKKKPCSRSIKEGCGSFRTTESFFAQVDDIPVIYYFNFLSGKMEELGHVISGGIPELSNNL